VVLVWTVNAGPKCLNVVIENVTKSKWSINIGCLVPVVLGQELDIPSEKYETEKLIGRSKVLGSGGRDAENSPQSPPFSAAIS
jgi:hypothetical protein